MQIDDKKSPYSHFERWKVCAWFFFFSNNIHNVYYAWTFFYIFYNKV